MAPQATIGRGGGRGGGRTTNTRGGQQRNRTTATKFQGQNKELGVFETADERIFRGRGQNQFVETMKTLQSYAARTLDTKEGKTDIRDVLRDMNAYDPEAPEAPTADETTGRYDEIELDTYRFDVSEYKRNMKAFKEGQTTMWAVIIGQTSKKMLSELEATKNYKDALESSDILALLKGIKIVSYKFDGHRHKPSTLLDASRELLNYKQGDQHIDDYYKEFKSRCDVIEQYGGTVGDYPTVIASCISKDKTVAELIDGLADGTITPEQYATAKAEAVEIIKAALFLQQSHKTYDPLRIELQNKYSQGKDDYPTTTEAAYNRLVTYVVSVDPASDGNRRRRPERATTTTDEQLAFVQQGQAADPAHNSHPDILCYNCQRFGHYSNECPLPDARQGTQESVSTLLEQENDGPDLCFCNHKSRSTSVLPRPSVEPDSTSVLPREHVVNPNWILIDSASTVDLFGSACYLRNIREADEPCNLYSNGGENMIHLIGDLPGFGPVWFDENSIANVLSMTSARKRFRITQDSHEYDGIRLHRPDFLRVVVKAFTTMMPPLPGIILLIPLLLTIRSSRP
jgi:hypothetical protein